MNDAPDVKVSDDQTVVPAWFAVWLLIFGAVIPALWDPPFWAVTLGLVLLFIIVRRRLLGKVWLALPLIGYLGWITLSLVWSVAPVTTVPQLFITLFTAAFGLLIAVGRSVRDLLELSVKAVAVVLIGSWLIAVLVPSLGISSEPGRSGAMQGLFNNKNAFGLFTTVALVTTTCHAIATRHDESKRRLAWAGVGLAAVSMLASTSRTALLVSVTLAVLGLALRRLARARRPLGLPVLGLTMTLGLLAATVIANFTTVLLWLGRDPTLTGRTHIWSVVIGAINEHDALGAIDLGTLLLLGWTSALRGLDHGVTPLRPHPHLWAGPARHPPLQDRPGRGWPKAGHPLRLKSPHLPGTRLSRLDRGSGYHDRRHFQKNNPHWKARRSRPANAS